LRKQLRWERSGGADVRETGESTQCRNRKKKVVNGERKGGIRRAWGKEGKIQKRVEKEKRRGRRGVFRVVV